MRRGAWIGLGLALLSVACGGGGESLIDAGDGLVDAPARGVDARPSFDPGPEPTAPMTPVPGEVTIIQLELPVGATLRLGEAAIVVGPDGTVALLDIGNSVHDDEVRDAVIRLNTVELTPANGFAARRPLEVDWMVITHFHGDHVGAFEDLMIGAAEPLEITRGIVHRGFVDVGDAMNAADYESFCAALSGSLASVDVPLCEASPRAGCDVAAFTGNHPATGCAGLQLGDLTTPSDDASAESTYIPLGGGARLTLIGADAHISDGTRAHAAPAFGHGDTNEENARSLIGVVSHGLFRYHFGGDLTGSGDAGEPDIESHLIDVAGSAFYGALGVDVAHLHHHARRTSSNATLVDALAPRDGRSRNAIAGINSAHVGSPDAETLAAWADDNRLGDGRVWATTVAPTGASHDKLINADGAVILQTIQSGLGYRIQAAGATLQSMPFPSIR